MTLNAKQQAFSSEYAVDNNGKQAAIRAGYSPHTAEVQASQLLSKLKVQDAVAIARDELSKKRVATFQQKQEILLELATFGSEKEGHEGKERQRNPSAAVSAIKELNTMDGDHEPTKHDHRVVELVVQEQDADL